VKIGSISLNGLAEHHPPVTLAQTLSILVVEDDEAVAELVRTILNDVPGWGATVVHDASAARTVFHHVRIEMLVLDVNLPGISGLELLALLRQDPHWNKPPTILMSAVYNQVGISEALRDGWATTFLGKPFDVDHLVQEIQNSLQ
jgi:DNA-binding response OmpR family regulator